MQIYLNPYTQTANAAFTASFSLSTKKFGLAVASGFVKDLYLEGRDDEIMTPAVAAVIIHLHVLRICLVYVAATNFFKAYKQPYEHIARMFLDACKPADTLDADKKLKLNHHNVGL